MPARRQRSTRPRAAYRKPDEVRAVLINATVELLSERPPAQVTVRAVAARAGVQHSLITRHFATKDELIAEALSVLTDDYAHSFDTVTDPVDGYLGALAYLRNNPTAAVAMAGDPAVRTGDSPQTRFPGYNTHLSQIIEAGAQDNDHTRILTALTMAVIAGWAFLEPTLVAAADVPHLDQAAIQDEVAQMIRRLIEREAEIETQQPEPSHPKRRRTS